MGKKIYLTAVLDRDRAVEAQIEPGPHIYVLTDNQFWEPGREQDRRTRPLYWRLVGMGSILSIEMNRESGRLLQVNMPIYAGPRREESRVDVAISPQIGVPAFDLEDWSEARALGLMPSTNRFDFVDIQESFELRLGPDHVRFVVSEEEEVSATLTGGRLRCAFGQDRGLLSVTVQGFSAGEMDALRGPSWG